MYPQLILNILRDRYKPALAVAVLTLVVGMVSMYSIPKQYTAETTVMVDIRSPDPVATVLIPPSMMPGSLGTQVEILKSDRVSHKVVRALKLDENPDLKRSWREATGGKGRLEDWIATGLERGLTVTPSRESNVLTIAFRAGDPGFAANAANAYAQAYIETSVELKVEPAKQYSRWFGEQAKLLRENVEKAQGRLSDFQQRKGIVATEETLDTELAKLTDLSSRLTAAQAETREAQSKRQPTTGTLPEVMQNPVISGLRTSIGQTEVKLKEAAVNLGVKHPQYLRMEQELAELKRRLADETSQFMSSYAASSSVGKNKEGELRAAVEAQKKKILDLRSSRDEISVLVRELETSKRSYDAITMRFNQTNLESQATQTNVSVLTPANEPLEPSFPKSGSRTLMLVVFLAFLLAAGVIAGLEMLDRRVRTSDDLAQMLQTPVLAVLEPARYPGRLAFKGGPAALPHK